MKHLQTPQPHAAPATPQHAPAPQQHIPPAVMAIRKSCDADGIGLSHYVLMDRKTGE